MYQWPTHTSCSTDPYHCANIASPCWSAAGILPILPSYSPHISDGGVKISISFALDNGHECEDGYDWWPTHLAKPGLPFLSLFCTASALHQTFLFLNNSSLLLPPCIRRHVPFSEQLFLYCVCIESNVTFFFEPTLRTFLSQILLNIARNISSGLGFCTICREWSLMDLKQIQLKKSITLPIQWDSKGCVVFVRGLKWKFWCGHLQSRAWLTSNSPHSPESRHGSLAEWLSSGKIQILLSTKVNTATYFEMNLKRLSSKYCYQGTGCEMYTETLSPTFAGMTFSQASE